MEKSKEKVLLVHNYYQLPGGEDTVVMNEKRMLEEHGHEVILYTRNNNELKKMTVIRKILLPFTTVFNLRTYFDIQRIIKEERIDIVHVHNTLNLISPAVYYAALSCNVPIVQTVHNFRMICPNAMLYRNGMVCEDCVNNGLFCAIKNGCYRYSKIQTAVCVLSMKIHRMLGIYKKLRYICLTEFNKEKLLSLKQIIPESVYIKPNFVSDNGDSRIFSERKNQFVYVGRVEHLKGINTLLEAWKNMGNEASKLLICGTGPMDKWCEEYIRINGIKNVEMMGFVPNESVRSIIAESKALILPTRLYEGFPVSIVEAFSVGTPVICSDIGNAGSIVSEDETGYKFRCDDPKDLCRAVKKACDKEILSDKIWNTYIERYSVDVNYSVLKEIYQKIINQ